MRKIYVTYVSGGIAKKAELSEERLNALKNSGTITEIQIHQSASLMEKKYGELLCSDGKCDNRSRLLS